MKIRIIINGAQGKMGRVACEVLGNSPDFEIVGCLGKQDDLRQEITAQKAEVVIDLTRADSVFKNSLTIIESGARPVIGTSGLSEHQIQELRGMCNERQLGGLIVPNFSIGAILMMQFAAKAASYIQDVEIIESHHPQKFDAPSGTAIKTAQMIAAVRTVGNNISCKETIPHVRGGKCQDVNIHSIRLSGVLAKQEVIFGSPGETLSIVHETTDRSAFKAGILLACQEVTRLTALYYGLETVIDCK